jgi:chromosome segregation ATPase
LASDLDISKKDLAKKEEELAEVKLHLESVEDTFESEVHEFKTNAETLASDLGISKKALAKKEEELADVKANLESVEYKIDEFEAKVGEKHEALTREKEAKESELKLLTIHFSEVVSSLQEEQMQRKAFGKEHKAEVAVLKGELDDTNARLEQVRSQL